MNQDKSWRAASRGEGTLKDGCFQELRKQNDIKINHIDTQKWGDICCVSIENRKRTNSYIRSLVLPISEMRALFKNSFNNYCIMMKSYFSFTRHLINNRGRYD